MTSPRRDDRWPDGGAPGPDGAGSTAGLVSVIRSAIEQFAQLSGHEAERVSGVRAADGGWSVLADVVELERIPSTTSVLATYRVDVDEAGNVRGYERLRRFVRGATDPM